MCQLVNSTRGSGCNNMWQWVNSTHGSECNNSCGSGLIARVAVGVITHVAVG